MAALIEANDLSKRFGAVIALDRLSLSIPQGGVYGILGANGAGKSTFFRICLDLLRPSGGSVSLMGAGPDDTVWVKLLDLGPRLKQFHDDFPKGDITIRVGSRK